MIQESSKLKSVNAFQTSVAADIRPQLPAENSSCCKCDKSKERCRNIVGKGEITKVDLICWCRAHIDLSCFDPKLSLSYTSWRPLCQEPLPNRRLLTSLVQTAALSEDVVLSSQDNIVAGYE